MNAKISEFVVCVEAIVLLLLHNLHDYTFNNIEVTEAVRQSCSIKAVFLKISQDSQENICAGVFFLIKVAGYK